ncbi:MAG: M23 family metallopeptidase [Rhodospirillaceae bacterium]
MRLALLFGVLLTSPALALDVTIAGKLEQGGLVIGTAPPGSAITVGQRRFPAAADGTFLVGLGRNAPAILEVKVSAPNGESETLTVAVAPREWKIDKVDGVPQNLVTPDPATEKRIAEDSKLLRLARAKFFSEPLYATGFIRPAEGRISGVYGSQRILNGEPRNVHAGLDIAAPTGAPIKAAADGIVTLAQPGMVLSGGTVLINHGYGLQTSYIHMSRLDVAEGQRVKQGEVIGAIGATGRVTGPHLHFSVLWFDTSLDPTTILALLPGKD